MTNVEQAIKEAVENGYQPEGYSYRQVHHKHMPQGITLKGTSTDFCIPETLLSPLFWQALGKARGWQKFTWTDDEGQLRSEQEGKEMEHVPGWGATLTWRYSWHRFIDHLASGKDAESFFAELA